MRAIASARINHPHGPQEHHFGPRHERVFPYYFWRAILRMVHSRSWLRQCLRVPCSGVSVYLACTLSWANSSFLSFSAFNRIGNLRAFNVAFSSIPTAPSSFHSYLRATIGSSAVARRTGITVAIPATLSKRAADSPNGMIGTWLAP
jgi:hypothetical protein